MAYSFTFALNRTVLRVFLFSFPLIIFCSANAQEKDSAALIPEIVLDGYKKPQKFISSTKSVSVSTPIIRNQNAPDQLLESLNLMPGTKMEERSPGSYRLSVRGSTLRSPFGVRNIKIYLDDFVFSDAGGASYLNALDPALISRTEIYKGPESGDFGAVTGGTALFKTLRSDVAQVQLEGGSYRFFKESAHNGTNIDNHSIQLFQSFSTTDSYRRQSALKRANFFVTDQWNYHSNSRLNFMLFYSNLNYETPGGLTYAQMLQDRKKARPATATLPGAEEQDVGIKMQMLMAGLSHSAEINRSLSHFISVQSSFVGLENPFITNFEKRNEDNLALRTHLNFEQTVNDWFLQSRLGFEGALNESHIKNYNYRSQLIGSPQHFDEVTTKSGFLFFSQKAEFQKKLFIESALSYNMMSYQWQRSFPSTTSGKITFRNQLLPDFGLSWLFADGFSVRGKIGKGSSAPTLEEIRSSDQRINTDLQPEFGWNKEIGIRKQFGKILFVELSAFDFRLKNAIVRQQDAAGSDYFVNAGGTVQQGIEMLLETRKFKINSLLINSVQLMASGNLYNFTFTDYKKDGKDFSGNEIPGVGKEGFQGVLSAEFFSRLKVDFANYYLPVFALDDANTIRSDASWLSHVTLRYRFALSKIKAELYLKINNLYNESHVLGYDLNAFGGRYYNPAPKRNYHAGFSFSF